jgi:hypothetical protein
MCLEMAHTQLQKTANTAYKNCDSHVASYKEKSVGNMSLFCVFRTNNTKELTVPIIPFTYRGSLLWLQEIFFNKFTAHPLATAKTGHTALA